MMIYSTRATLPYIITQQVMLRAGSSFSSCVHRQFHQQHRWLAVVEQTYFLRIQKSGDTEASLMIKFSNMERISSALVFYVTDLNAQENPDIH